MTDPIHLVETVYELASDEGDWLARMAEAFVGLFPHDQGILAFSYDASCTGRVAIRATRTYNIDARFFAARSQVALKDSEQPFFVPILRTGFVDTLRHSPDALRRTGLSVERVREYELRLDGVLREWNLADQFWINAQDPTYFGCLFIVPSAVRRRWQPLEAARWRRIAAHVSSAFRIRRQLSSVAGALADASNPEAIFRPDGRLEHAEEAAQADPCRAALRRAVLALDRARGPLRRRDPERAMALWQAMVAGRWSLLDHFDSDGRRFVVAHRNDAGVPDMRGL
jgi:hypothetical protein